MDVCGGREDADGNYGYYVTVDFPYILQCYRGDTSKTIPEPRDGNCGLYGVNCDFRAPGGAGGQNTSERPRECCRTRSCEPGYQCPPPPGRKKRSLASPTLSWIKESLQFHGGEGPYFKSKFGDIASRHRRSVQELTDAINRFLNSDDGASSNLDTQTFLRHLSYSCDKCNGKRNLDISCNGIRNNTCTSTCQLFSLNGPSGESFECRQTLTNEKDTNGVSENGQMVDTSISADSLALSATVTVLYLLILT